MLPGIILYMRPANDRQRYIALTIEMQIHVFPAAQGPVSI